MPPVQLEWVESLGPMHLLMELWSSLSWSPHIRRFFISLYFFFTHRGADAALDLSTILHYPPAVGVEV